jgi:aquaporin Z
VFAEAWGTFLLVLVAAGGGVVAAMSSGKVTLGMMVVAPGLMVMAIIYFMGAVSGAHLNPAVTLAFAVRRDFPWQRVPGYVVGQLIGGLGAAAFLRAMFGTAGALGATLPGRGVTNGKALAMEVVLTTGLVSTILGTAYGARNVGTNGAVAVGGYIALAGLWAAPITGSSMNPVRSLAPDVLRGDLHTTWIYVLGPVIGASQWPSSGFSKGSPRRPAESSRRARLVATTLLGQIPECEEQLTPYGLPVTASNGMSPGSVHYCSDRKELRMREWCAGVFDHRNSTSPGRALLLHLQRGAYEA